MSAEHKETFDFEKGMSRLEEIISRFDQGGLPLDEMEKIFLEGMDLIQKCTQRLDKFEAKVTQLVQDVDGEWTEEDFEEELEDEDDIRF